MASNIDIIVPDLGDFADVEVIEILVAGGDKVAREDGLITLETDKAAMDVPSPEGGVIDSISVAVGDKVSGGDVIGKMTVEIGDTVVIAPAIASMPTGETTIMVTPAGKASPKSGGKQTLVVPDIGGFEDVEVIEVHIGGGDTIAVEDPLVTLETDKAAMDVPAVVAGTIESVIVKVGDKVSEGSTLAVIDAIAVQHAATAPSKSAKRVAEPPQHLPKRPAQAPATRITDVSQSGTTSAICLPAIDEARIFESAHASPSVRKLARELGVDLVAGQRHRDQESRAARRCQSIRQSDSHRRCNCTGRPPLHQPPPCRQVPVIDFSQSLVKSSVQPLTRIQKISGPRLQASWINLPACNTT